MTELEIRMIYLFIDMLNDEKISLVYTQGPIEYEKLFSNGKKAKKEFYKNDVYWTTLFINDRVILKKVSERDRTGRLN